MGGPYPLHSLSRLYSRPTKSRTRSSPLGAMGATGDRLAKVNSGQPLVPCGCHGSQGPKAPWPPLGGNTLARRLRIGGGRCVPPNLFPTYSPSPGWPPILGVLCRAFCYRFLPIFRTFLGGSYREPLMWGAIPGGYPREHPGKLSNPLRAFSRVYLPPQGCPWGPLGQPRPGPQAVLRASG